MMRKMNSMSFVKVLKVAREREAETLVSALKNGDIEINDDTTWKSVVDEISRAIGCLPSAFPDKQGHLFRRIAELKADAGIGDY